MDDPELRPDERALLRAWLRGRRKEAPPPEQLADWLSGRRDGAAGAAVEEALAADPALRAAVVALHQRAREVGSAEDVARARALGLAMELPGATRATATRPYGRLLRALPAAGFAAAAGWMGWTLGFALGGDGLATPAAETASLLGLGPTP